MNYDYSNDINVEQEIWDDFKCLSEGKFLEGILFDERRSLISVGLNKRLEYDEDYKINKFLASHDPQNINWDELKNLYPYHAPIELLIHKRYDPPAKFRTHKERREIDYILLNDWEDKKIRLLSKIPNEDSAEDYLINIRWENGNPVCPRCGSHKIFFLNSNVKFKCGKCWLHFSERVGTIFQNSKLPLMKWYESIYLFTEIKTRKISTHQLAKTIQVTQKTAWGMANKIQSKVNEEFLSKIKFRLFT